MAQQKSLLVTGIPPGATREQLQIHFQRSRNGGGDVTYVLYPMSSSKKTALVTFEREEVCKKVLETTQLFDEHWLEIKPLPQQVYSDVYAVIDEAVVKSIPLSRFDSVIQGITSETGVVFEYKELQRSNECLLRGNFYQIQCAQRMLQKVCAVSERRESSSRSHGKIVNGPTAHTHPVEPGQMNGVSGEVHNGEREDRPAVTATHFGSSSERPSSRGRHDYSSRRSDFTDRQPDRPPSRGTLNYTTSDLSRQANRPSSRGPQDYTTSNGRTTDRPPSRSGREEFDDRRSTDRPPSRGARDYGTHSTFITATEEPASRSRPGYGFAMYDDANKGLGPAYGRDDAGPHSSDTDRDKPRERPPSRSGREEPTVRIENYLESMMAPTYARPDSHTDQEFESMPVSDVLSTMGSERPGSRNGINSIPKDDIELLFADSMASEETTKADIAADVSNFEVCPIAVDMDVYMYMKHTQERKLNALERDCDVLFQCDGTGDAGMISILPRSERTITDQLKLARDQFIVHYDNIYQTIDKFDFHLPKGLDESEVVSAIEDVKIRFCSVYFKKENSEHYALYGDKPTIQAAQLHVLSKLCKVFNVDSDGGRGVSVSGSQAKELETEDDLLSATVNGSHRELSHTPEDVIQPTEDDEPQPSKDSKIEDAEKLEDEGDEETTGRREPSGGSESEEIPSISKPSHGVTVLRDTEREITFMTDHGVKLRLYPADITKLPVDTITNAAHEQLINTGGVAYAIRKAAGRHYHRECEEYIDNHGPLFVTEVIHTSAGILPCKYVVHAVGPRWDDYKNKNECIDALKNTFVNCFNHANDLLQAASIALPPISAGIFGVPLDMVAQAMFDAVMEFSLEHPRNKKNLTLTDIHFVDCDRHTVSDMRKVLQENLRLVGCVVEEPKPTSRATADKPTQRVVDRPASPRPSHNVTDRLTHDVGDRSSHTVAGKPSRSAVDRPRPSTPIGMVSRERSNMHLPQKRPSTPPPSWLRKSTGLGDRSDTDQRLFSSERFSRPLDDGAEKQPQQRLSSSAKYTSPLREPHESPKKTPATDKSAFKQYKVSSDLDRYVPTKSLSSPRSGITGEKIQPVLRPKTADSYKVKRSTEHTPMKPLRATVDVLASTEDGAVGGEPATDTSTQDKDKDALVREILAEYEHGPQTQERSHQTQKMLDDVLAEDDPGPLTVRGARTRTRSLDRARPKTADASTRSGRSSSLDRKRPVSGVLEKGSTVRRCQLCRTNRNLSMMKDCPHFICSTCKKYSRDCYDCLQLKMGEKDKNSLKVQASTVNPAPSTISSPPSPRPARQQLTTKRVQRPRSATPNPTSSTRECPICFSGVTNAKTLHKCQHTFCRNCIDTAMGHKPVCPVCGYIYGPMIGNQPEGTMEVSVDKGRQLPGYGGCGTIMMTYNFPDGTQSNEHPNPGRPYQGTKRRAYLPDNTQGREVLKLLQRAFKSKLLFTVGQSVTTGLDNTVVWNDVHQKTSRHGGPANHGYPDPFYLRRVKEELAAKGIK